MLWAVENMFMVFLRFNPVTCNFEGVNVSFLWGVSVWVGVDAC